MRRARAWLVPAVGVFLIGLATIVALWWSRHLATVTLTEQAAIVSLADRVQQRLAMGHLWLEEGLSGDEQIELARDVLVPFDQALALVTAGLEGGVGARGENVSPARGSELRSALMAVRDKVLVLRNVAEHRWRFRNQGGGVGTADDQSFDAHFTEVLSRCQELSNAVQRETEVSRGRLSNSFSALMALAVVLLAGAGVQISRSQRELGRRQVELEARVAERTEELRLKANEAEQASRAKGAFLAGMSHEIRTPLNAVIGMTDLLVDSPLNSEQRELITTIQTSGQALLGVINDILDYSKIESGKLDLEHAPLDAQDCVEEAMDVVAVAAATKGIELSYEVMEGTEVTLVGDAGRLRQVLVNLLSNAIKFTDAGSVHATVSHEVDPSLGRVLRFAVSDTGIGIPESARDRLFQSFSQVDSGTARKYGGTGLGLAICKQIVELMKGRIGVESEPGRGSTFWFVIRHEGAPAPRRPWREASQAFLAGRRALIVDDNSVNIRLLSLQLSRWGLAVDSARSAREALDLVQSGGRFDVALLDVHMPEIDGWTLIGLLRETEVARHLPIVVLSSALDRPPGDLAVSALLNKPVKQSRLYFVLANLFDHAGHASAPAHDKERGQLRLAERLPRRILLAEDHPINQRVALGALRKLGYEPDLAQDGRAVLTALERRRYDIILMDVQMPELDGLEATRAVRERCSAEDPWVIALTANASVEDRHRCLQSGMNDYLSKPLRVRDLVAALERSPGGAGAAKETASPPAPPHSDVGLLDRETVEELRGLELLPEMIGLFAEQAPPLIEGIHAARTSADYQELAHLAHRLKGASATVGAAALSSLAHTIEAEAEAAGGPGPVVAISELKALMMRSLDCLEREQSGSNDVQRAQA